MTSSILTCTTVFVIVGLTMNTEDAMTTTTTEIVPQTTITGCFNVSWLY